MRAAVLCETPGWLEIDDLDIDRPGPNEVLVRTAAASACHSDLHHMNGGLKHPLPVVMGHESAGVVEAVGADVRDVAPGDHVVTCLSVFCGHCDQCLSGRAFRCFGDEPLRARRQPRLTRRDGARVHQFYGLGGFAEQILVSEHGVVKVPDAVPLDRAALLGCGVMTGLGAVFNTARVTPGASVVVIGLGGVGLAAVQGARIAGATTIVAVDRVAEKLELARKVGATATVDAGGLDTADAVEAVREITGGGADHSFEAVGTPTTVRQSFDMIGRGGTATVIGMLNPGDEVVLTAADLISLKRFQSTAMGAGSFRVDVPRYARMYLSGQLDLDSLVSRRLALDDVNEAFHAMEAGDGARHVVTFPAG
jgi:S-(hydroxymethyl)glutathione dehydrogenase/alcohol dehydrogenase